MLKFQTMWIFVTLGPEITERDPLFIPQQMRFHDPLPRRRAEFSSLPRTKKLKGAKEVTYYKQPIADSNNHLLLLCER